MAVRFGNLLFFYFDIPLQAEEKRQTPSTEMCPAPIFLLYARASAYTHVQTQKNYKGTAISKPMNLSSTPSTT